MPYYYDVNPGALTSNGSSNTEGTYLRAATVANQETASIKGIFVAARFTTAGGAQFRAKTNTGGSATGGQATYTPAARNLRGNPASQTLWWWSSTGTITAGGTLTTRLSIGFALTGGMGGWVPVEAPDSLVMMANATNPVDMEFTVIASQATAPLDATIEFSEGY